MVIFQRPTLREMTLRSYFLLCDPSILQLSGSFFYVEKMTPVNILHRSLIVLTPVYIKFTNYKINRCRIRFSESLLKIKVYFTCSPFILYIYIKYLYQQKIYTLILVRIQKRILPIYKKDLNWHY